jgi:hypothetical protein
MINPNHNNNICKNCPGMKSCHTSTNDCQIIKKYQSNGGKILRKSTTFYDAAYCDECDILFNFDSDGVIINHTQK